MNQDDPKHAIDTPTPPAVEGGDRYGFAVASRTHGGRLTRSDENDVIELVMEGIAEDLPDEYGLALNGMQAEHFRLIADAVLAVVEAGCEQAGNDWMADAATTAIRARELVDADPEFAGLADARRTR